MRLGAEIGPALGWRSAASATYTRTRWANIVALTTHRRVNGRLEHLRGTALGFSNVTNYIAGSRLEPGGFRPQLQPRL
jgi:hypothetical protein